MKVVSIVGARPEFVQATPVSKALRAAHHEVLVHTGQHYDYRMSQTFFDELGTPAPDYNLEAGSGSHAKQTGEILVGIERVLLAERPDWVLVRGDTNSTIAGALAASKLHIPIAHIEAGERSFDRRMPEEINRLVSDRLADVHFCVSATAKTHLAAEGITATAHVVGDVMLDASIQNRVVAERQSKIVESLGLTDGKYALVTVHRAANTDSAERLDGIVRALNQARETVIFPVHPRTRAALDAHGIKLGGNVKAIYPVGYFDMMMLEAHARLIATDSGGVQREAYFLGVPCLTLRDETEWSETVSAGWNQLVGADSEIITAAWHSFAPAGERPPIFGGGDAAIQIVGILERLQNS